MNLADYLKISKRTETDLAREVGCHVSTISRLCRGQRLPSLSLAEKIAVVTKGAVTPNDYSRAA